MRAVNPDCKPYPQSKIQNPKSKSQNPLRQLITEAKVRAAGRAGARTLAVDDDALITPLARDTARTLGLTFVPHTVQATPPSAPLHLLAIGSDHGGFAYKETLKGFATGLGWQVVDVGTDTEKSCDYPDFAYAVARAVAGGQAGLGLMIDGAGLGSAMACNKVPGIRAACAYNSFTAWNARAHNDANVLTLGSRTLGIEVCKRVLQTFLETSFEGGRHAGRVQKITDLETHFGNKPSP